MARTAKAEKNALGAVHADYGPAIRRQAIRALDGTMLREADVEKHEGPDPDFPERQFNVSRGIRWLPLKLHKSGQIEKDHVAVAEAYRNQLDLASGVMGMNTTFIRAGGTGTSSVIDVQVAASLLLEKADRAMGRETTRVIRLALAADTASEVALACGIDRKRVAPVVKTALADLKAWWYRYGKS